MKDLEIKGISLLANLAYSEPFTYYSHPKHCAHQFKLGIDFYEKAAKRCFHCNKTLIEIDKK